MQSSYTVTWNGSAAGIAGLLEESGKITVSAEADLGVLPEQTPVRLVAECARGDVSIGIPVPRGQKLYLRKSFSTAQAEKMGLFEVSGFRLAELSEKAVAVKDTEKVLEEADGEWIEESDPGAFFKDAELRWACRGVLGTLSRRVKDGAYELAVPADSSQPFPLLPVFKYGDVMQLGGRMYVVFKLRGGELV